jgi:hypothetical protein
LTVSITSDNIPHAKSKRGRQSAPPPHNEKGASHQNRKAEKISQVGRKHDDRKGDAPSEDLPAVESTGSGARSGWFDDKTKEIGDEASDSQSEFRWF